MSFDNMLQHGREFSQIGKLEADELGFIVEVFFANPRRYGLFGKKIDAEITDFISNNDVAKYRTQRTFFWKVSHRHSTIKSRKI